MRKTLLALSLLTAVSSYALTVDEMLARFNKVKQKSKHRHGVVMERYVNVHSELAPSRSGSYEASDFGRTLTLDVHADRTVTGRGAEDGRTFELRDGRVEGSHLTATKRFADGDTEPLEGIFINLRRMEGRTPQDIASDRTTFGLGVTSVHFTFGGSTFDKLFYERK
ncbi:MAG TPA: hypothetical protein VJZ00_21115 [Thermoanaerobaculia bacterium]|nr:hypothetical protein [Thermoanaerobaculia bacterium]